MSDQPAPTPNHGYTDSFPILSEPSPVITIIAIVEDNPDSRDVFKLMFEVLGRSVMSVDSVAAAFNLPWSLISHALVDWMMPDVDGTELIHWLRRNHPHVRVALCTAASNVEDIPPLDCEIISKPVAIEELRQWLMTGD